MRPTVVANWKMQLGLAESVKAGTELHRQISATQPEATVVVCPSFVALPYFHEPFADGRIQLGAQDLFWSDKGAFTGEVSPLTLQETGARYVIIGHSERRHLGETDTDVARKTLAALAHSLMPIICVGETGQQRTENRHEVTVQSQLKAVFRSTPPPTRGQVIYIAYEPVWAIGTGEPADPDTAESMRELIRQTLIDLIPAALVESSFRILYGGSVNVKNVPNYVRTGRYDGALVGGASLDPNEFTQLINACVAATAGAEEK